MKLEEKIHAKEVEKTTLQAKSKVNLEEDFSMMKEKNSYWSEIFIWSNGLCCIGESGRRDQKVEEELDFQGWSHAQFLQRASA